LSLFIELKRRNVFRVVLAYGIMAWLIAQIAGLSADSFEAPAWVMKMIITMLILGLPVAILMAWAYELTPEGLRRESDIEAGHSTARATASKLDRTITIALVLAVIYFSYDKFILAPQQQAASSRVNGSSPAQMKTGQAVEIPSIAVLPFVDMSPDKDQEYIGDGIAEELLDQLARLLGINVAGRTSSFAFKGTNQSLKSIGEQLGVSNILEGSIRKQDNKLRITAQLINSQTGFHLWSKTYDRQMDDIFFVQEDIARSVAGALSITLHAGGREPLWGAGTSSIEAYDVYMRAMNLRRHGQREQARILMQQAVEIDPEYAEAWVALGSLTMQKSWLHSQEQVQGLLDEGLEMVLKALDLNPELSSAWGALGGFKKFSGDWVGNVEASIKAAELAPGNARFQVFDPLVERGNGLISRSISWTESAMKTRPLSYGGAQVLSEYYIQVRRYDDARATLEISTSLNTPSNPSIILRHLFIALCENDTVAIRERLEALAVVDPAVGAIIRLVLANFDFDHAVIIELLRRHLHESTDMTGDGLVLLASLAAYYGDPELALEAMTQELGNSLIRIARLWYPFFSEMRQLPGFKTLVEDHGLVTFWRTYVWADYCRPVGDEDFECF
jgi:TolB-like protein/tetratricopeptide (TPR) repeat protein